MLGVHDMLEEAMLNQLILNGYRKIRKKSLYCNNSFSTVQIQWLAPQDFFTFGVVKGQNQCEILLQFVRVISASVLRWVRPPWQGQIFMTPS
jgi:hypothetical protein